MMPTEAFYPLSSYNNAITWCCFTISLLVCCIQVHRGGAAWVCPFCSPLNFVEAATAILAGVFTFDRKLCRAAARWFLDVV